MDSDDFYEDNDDLNDDYNDANDDYKNFPPGQSGSAHCASSSQVAHLQIFTKLTELIKS